MNKYGEGRIAVIGLAVVIIIAGFFIIRHMRTVSGPRYSDRVDWVCEECDRMFAAPYQWETRECTSCGGEAVKVHMYFDTESGELVALYREKPLPGSEPEMGKELIKLSGGGWEYAEVLRDPVTGMPVPEERMRGLIYAPYGTEHRTGR